VFAPSIVYAPGDRLLTFLERLSLLSPLMPLSGRGEALYQPIWVHDVVDCVMNALALEGLGSPDGHERFELAGPRTLSHRALVELVLRAAGRQRRLASIPSPIVCRALRLAEMVLKSRAPLTWDEAELLEVSMTSARGTDDVNALGVTPLEMEDVLAGGWTSYTTPRAAPPTPAAGPRRQGAR
jgi:NADH dehydrogenase